MMRADHIDENQLALLMEGKLEPERLEALEDHVDRCAACSELMIQIASSLGPAGDGEGEGAAVGRYRLGRVLGRGGMGVVHEAFDPVLERKVALKLVRPEFAGDSEGGERTERLLREARALAALAHPNVVAVHDAGVVDGRVFVAAELVTGRTVTAWVAEEAPGLEAVVDVYVQAARGIEAAHRAGIVHRDIKPDNIMVGDDGRVWVADFGLATAGSARDSIRALATTIESGDAQALGEVDLTITGALMGTPLYMAPEQLAGEAVDERSDQFSLCVSLYESRYRQRPFAGRTLGELADAVLAGRVRPVELGSARARALHEVILRGLSVESAARYPSMAALADDLAAVVGAPLPSGTGARVAAGVAAAIIAVVGVVVLSRSGAAPAGPDAMVAAAPAPVVTNPVSSAPAAGVSPPDAAPAADPVAAAPGKRATGADDAARLWAEFARQVGARNGDCLAVYQKATATGVDPVFDAGMLHARCQMLAGDCESGQKTLRAFLDRQPIAAAAIEQDVAREARMHCATSDGPWPERLARIGTQVHYALAHRDLAVRLDRDLHAVVRDAGPGLDRDRAIDVYNAARPLAEALARHDLCPRARAVVRLGNLTYLGPDRADEPPGPYDVVSATLKACL
jgi:hypothetical protein